VRREHSDPNPIHSAGDREREESAPGPRRRTAGIQLLRPLLVHRFVPPSSESDDLLPGFMPPSYSKPPIRASFPLLRQFVPQIQESLLCSADSHPYEIRIRLYRYSDRLIQRF